VKFAFIRDHLAAYEPTMVCRVLQVSRSGYYAWLGRPASRRQQRRDGLAVKVQAAHAEHRRVYGSPRIHAVLTAGGEKVCVNTVAKIMREKCLRARAKRRFTPRTTIRGEAYNVTSTGAVGSYP